MAEMIGFMVAYVVGFRVACLVDAWSGSLMLDVVGFGFLVASPKATVKHPKPGIGKHQSSRIINHAPVIQFMADGLGCRVGTNWL